MDGNGNVGPSKLTFAAMIGLAHRDREAQLAACIGNEAAMCALESLVVAQRVVDYHSTASRHTCIVIHAPEVLDRERDSRLREAYRHA